MRILFDQGTPRPLRTLLRPHSVTTTYVKGWDRLKNGELLDAAEKGGFEMLITTDKNVQHQQNLKHRKIAVLVLSRSKWPDVKLSVPRILDALSHVKPGTCTVVECMLSFGTFLKEDEWRVNMLRSVPKGESSI